MILSVAELSVIDFGSAHRWSVILDGVGISTSKGLYIPATNVEEHIASIKTRDFDVGVASLKLPIGLEYPSINVTFVDDVNYTIHKQLEAWAKEIIVNGRVCLSKRKTINIVKYGIDLAVLWNHTYEVTLENGVKFLGENTPSNLTNSMALTVLSKSGGGSGGSSSSINPVKSKSNNNDLFKVLQTIIQ